MLPASKLRTKVKKAMVGQAPVAHVCNPSYSGGRGQDSGSKPAWANSSWDPISKKPYTKQGWWSGSSDKGACLASQASMRLWVQIPVLKKKKKGLIQLRMRGSWLSFWPLLEQSALAGLAQYPCPVHQNTMWSSCVQEELTDTLMLSWREVFHRMPQGSILGGILVNIFNQWFGWGNRWHANQILGQHKSGKEIKVKIQGDLNRLTWWAKSNRLNLMGKNITPWARAQKLLYY
jgi:hypothetical protein